MLIVVGEKCWKFKHKSFFKNPNIFNIRKKLKVSYKNKNLPIMKGKISYRDMKKISLWYKSREGSSTNLCEVSQFLKKKQTENS